MRKRVIIVLVLASVGGLATALWLSFKAQHSPNTVTDAAGAHVEEPQTPVVPAGADLSKAQTPNISETVSIGIPAHSGVYSYREIELGETRARVTAKLKAMGYRTLDCEDHDGDVCSVEETPDPGVSDMEVYFKRDRLLRLTFNFNPSELNKYVEAVTGTYGPPSRPLHDPHDGMGGMVADWQDGFVEPCRSIRVTTFMGGRISSAHPHRDTPMGMFWLTLIDSSSFREGAETNVDACAELAKDG